MEQANLRSFEEEAEAAALRAGEARALAADEAANAGEGGISIKVALFLEGLEPKVGTLSASGEYRTSVASDILSRQVYQLVKSLGGRVPEEAVKELMDNLIHADFKDVVVSIMDKGNVVRISDKGPGIEDKERAFKFGYSGASTAALQETRGIGAGLGIVLAAVEKVGGTVTIDDNIGGGTVATVSVGKLAQTTANDKPIASLPQAQKRKHLGTVRSAEQALSVLSERQQNVLLFVFACDEEVGPSTVAEGSVTGSVSTAYRELSVLEEYGLVTGSESGKREITPLGQDVVLEIFEKRNERYEQERLLLERERQALEKQLQATQHRLRDIGGEPNESVVGRKER